MNRRFGIAALIVLSSIPAVSFASEMVNTGIEFAAKCVVKPIRAVHIACNTSPSDVWNQATNMTIAKLPIFSAFLQDGQQKDYATKKAKVKKGEEEYQGIPQGRFYGKYTYPILTALTGVGIYVVATDTWQARTKFVNALKIVRYKVCGKK